MLRSLEVQSRLLASLVGGGAAGSDPSGLAAYPPPGLGSPSTRMAGLDVWRNLLATRPEEITHRVRLNRDQALGGAARVPGAATTMRAYFTTEVPFGNAKTAAYLLFGMADVADLLEHGKVAMAEAHLQLLLAAGEQAALQAWQWPLAWLLTQLPEPPWAMIKHHPAPDAARPLSRLADQSMMSAVVSYFRDVTTVLEAQRKATIPPAAATGTPGPTKPGATTPGPKGAGRPNPKKGTQAAADAAAAAAAAGSEM